jgi:hypothetical protein
MESKKQSISRQQAGMEFLLASAGFYYVLLFNPEDGGDDPLKHQAPSKLHNIRTHMTLLFTVTIVRASNPIWLPGFLHLSVFVILSL